MRSADLVPILRDRSVERKNLSVTPLRGGRILGSALLALIYGIAVYASKGLFDSSSTDPYHAAMPLLGILNIGILPILMLVTIAGIRRIWLEGVPTPRLCRLLMAPLWTAFILSLLTVPLWMGMANVDRQAAAPAASGYSVAFLLAPWGFMVAYGLALFVTGAMFDFTFPVMVEANAQSSTAAP
ncbi:MAG: hypothetical protein ACR2JW_14760 [Thermomicrobiales bacterium]